MKKFRTSGIFWGIVLIAAAALLLLDSLAPVIGLPDLPFIRILISVALAAWGISEIAKGNVKGIVFPLAFIFIVLQTNISAWCGLGGRRLISAWIVLLAALFIYAGLALIFRRKKGNGFHVSGESGSSSVSADGTDFESNMRSSVHYIDASKLGEYHLENNMGSLTVYVENPEAYAGSGVIRIENNLGSAEIYVPAGWKVADCIDNSLGGTDNYTYSNVGPTLTVRGENNLGSVKFYNKK